MDPNKRSRQSVRNAEDSNQPQIFSNQLQGWLYLFQHRSSNYIHSVLKDKIFTVLIKVDQNFVEKNYIQIWLKRTITKCTEFVQPKHPKDS